MKLSYDVYLKDQRQEDVDRTVCLTDEEIVAIVTCVIYQAAKEKQNPTLAKL